MTNPSAVLTATRTRLLASDTVASLASQNLLATSDGGAVVTIGVDPKSGLPWVMQDNACSVTLDLRDREWMNAANSARFPVVAIGVWAKGDAFLSDGQLLARQVAMGLALELDDPANAKPKQWTADVYVNTCRWSGYCACVAVDGAPGLWRAEVQIEMQIV